ncbi:NAD(P)H-dependent oxidoreductase [Chitinophaga oryzae]|uniref:NAD(P)H-dependent oxidoreductase n=1 Tax=Chitinophaga oryzae TaxID=2725414 RepID=A0AAE7D703_9BACT|nr:NAD(P)H-dependent oxidoreductase [Chitinophaga oryzae]QJB31711.1 NAD(P)H-dependent oxidoreductase [Chitinophaga oryzae]QJB38195.1 NAD(P)H-dependent oxidoreductase [Chitinophaga oryzae]
MRTVIVYNHPYEGSFCNAILNAVTKSLQKARHEVDLIHLDKDGFNPVMSEADLKAFIAHRPVDPQVIDYSERVKKADHLIFIFPIWWDIMPATTKGFIDRVLSPGVVYDHHPRGFGLVPLLSSLKSVTIITTMNKPKILYSLLIGNLIRKVMLRSVFKTMGYKNLHWMSFTSVKSRSHEQRVKWLHDIENNFYKRYAQGRRALL